MSIASPCPISKKVTSNFFVIINFADFNFLGNFATVKIIHKNFIVIESGIEFKVRLDCGICGIFVLFISDPRQL